MATTLHGLLGSNAYVWLSVDWVWVDEQLRSADVIPAPSKTSEVQELEILRKETRTLHTLISQAID